MRELRVSTERRSQLVDITRQVREAVAGEDGAAVLVSSTVKDLVAGSGISFEERGTHELKGVPGSWSLYAVDRVTA